MLAHMFPPGIMIGKINQGRPEPPSDTITNFLNRSKSDRKKFAVAQDGKEAITCRPADLLTAEMETLTVDLMESVQTMTAYIVQASMGDTPHGTIEYYSLFAVAGVLFLFTLALNIGSRMITANVRKKFA